MVHCAVCKKEFDDWAPDGVSEITVRYGDELESVWTIRLCPEDLFRLGVRCYEQLQARKRR
jgi:hypothetical protein